MTKPVRLDAELVRRGLAGSRSEARVAIEDGRVLVTGLPDPRVSSLVSPDAAITLQGPPRRFVSRGGDKLDAALARLNVEVEGRRWLDAGASTGGFTDRLLKGGAAAVVALDVGYGQLHWSLRTDERVVVLERKNVRSLHERDLPWKPDGVVADLSFISLTLVLPALSSVLAEPGDALVMVKPQFEVGRALVGRGGVVRDPALWLDALHGVVAAAAGTGLGLQAAVPSEVPGPAGNREFFLHLRRGGRGTSALLEQAVEEVSAAT